VAAVLLGAWGLPAAGTPATAALLRPAALAPPPLPAAFQPIGALPDARQLSFEVTLAPRDPAGLSELLTELYDPTSPLYHHWLSPAAFDERFAPSPATVAATLAWLRSLGLEASYTSGFSVSAHGTATQVRAGLGIGLEQYRTPSGRAIYASRGTPEVPAAIASSVTSIVGLSNAPVAAPAVVPASAGGGGSTVFAKGAAPGAAKPSMRPGLGSAVAGSQVGNGATPSEVPQTTNGAPAACAGATSVANTYGGYTPPEIGAAYGIDALIADGANGAGQQIAVFELAPSSAADVAAFQSCFGLHVPVTVVSVDGGGTPDTLGTEEADLDIEQAAAQAPGAQVLSYEGPDTASGFLDTWQRIVSDDTASVVSSGWGLCEPLTAGSQFAGLDPLLQQAAAQGQSIFTAAGDSGSEDCYPVNSSTALSVDYPSSNPWVTAVGGTSRSLDGTETAWNGCQGVTAGSGCIEGPVGGGGGVSQVEPKPTWQAGIPTPAGFSCGANGTNCRLVPDISADAGVPVAFYTNGSWQPQAGTSVAAPLLAGLWADRNSGCGLANSGDAAPTLYRFAPQGYGSAIDDIVSGDNDVTGTNGGQFSAGPGFDLATGLGSPIAPGLACTAVISVSPPQAPAGTAVTVSGLGLQSATISFGGVPAQVVSETASSATVIAPPGSGSVSVVATGSIQNAPVGASFTYGTPVGAFSRIYGQTAIDTAIAVSQAMFPNDQSAPAVVLARSDFFSDALAGGPLAAQVGGPLLITPGAPLSSTLDPSVEAEIQRVLKPGGTVYVLGGDLALSPNIDTTLSALGYVVHRIAGTDEFATAVQIADELGTLMGHAPTTIFEATGLNFPDALSAVPAAVETHGAILLTDGTVQSSATAAYLSTHAVIHRYAIGGPLAAAGADPSATAIYGNDLWGTSAAVAAYFFPHPTRVGAATGLNFPDALAAGPSLGLEGAPLLLVEPTGLLPSPIASYLAQVGAGVTQGTLFGGPLAVADTVLGELDGAVG